MHNSNLPDRELAKDELFALLWKLGLTSGPSYTGIGSHMCGFWRWG